MMITSSSIKQNNAQCVKAASPISRIAFAGAPDSEKTTLATHFAAQCSIRGHLASYINEAARDYINSWKEQPSFDNQLFFTLKQIERESLATPHAEFIFFDSPIFLSYIYASLQIPIIGYSIATKNVDVLSHIFSLSLKHLNYTRIFYLKPFRTPIQDGVRPPNSEKFNEKVDNSIRNFLDIYCPGYITIDSSTLEERKKEIDEILFSPVVIGNKIDWKLPGEIKSDCS